MSAILTAAIERQLTTRTKRNELGQLLCRRCEDVIPPDHSIVFWDPANESKVWGPCCSDECICHLKICSECEQDFIIDKEGEITHIGDGVWLCKHCIQKVELCSFCGKKGTLVETPLGTMCKSCKDKIFFTCKHCNTLKDKRSESIKLQLDNTQKAQWGHVHEGDHMMCMSCFNKKKVGKDPLPIGVCKCCGNTYNLHPESPDYCIDCINNQNVKKCVHCNQYVTRWESKGGKCICRTCFPKLIQCPSCRDNYFFPKEGTRIKGSSRTYLICPKCASGKKKFVECPSCMGLVKEGSLRAVKGKKDACSFCLSRYNHCDTCGEYHFNENYCRSRQVQIMDYSYKPQTYFNGSLNDRVFFGFENEINYTDENYESAKTAVLQGYPSSVLYAKKDGSIAGRGFEIVSHPMSLNFFNNLDLEPMYRVTPRERDTSCGLHVHVSRTSFDGQAHLFKLTQFINGNKTFTKKIAGRDFNSYAREYQEKISKAVKGTASRERYHAINLTNKTTVEIRIFKSARNEFQLRYRIEFVNAALEFTRSNSILNLNEANFKEWLKKGTEYKNLKKFLKLEKK